MLPNKILARHARRFLTVFLLLSPLVYLAGAWLALRHDPNALTDVGVDRKKALAIAADFAATKGLNVSGWDTFCHFKLNKELYFYYRLEPNAERNRARAVAPATVVGALFRSPDRKENFEVEMAVDGRVLGFEHRFDQASDENDPGESAAKAIAQGALQQRLAALGFSYPVDLQQTEATGNKKLDPEGKLARPKGVRQYTWRWPLVPPAELKVESVLTVRAGKLVRDSIEANVEPAFASQRLNKRRWLRGISLAVYSLLITIFVIYGIYRFIQRARQKEVSYLRVLIPVFIFAVAMTGFQASTDTALYDVASAPTFPASDWVILFSAAVSYVVTGLFMGLAYGSGEGDIREAYPGKLTSLDALFTGRLFSRNVARSALWGWAIGGWVMLFFQLGPMLWRNVPASGKPPNEFVDAWVGHLPVLSPFMAWPLDVILVTVIGLLVPLPFVLRRKRLGSARMPLLFIFAWIACAAPYLDFRPWEATLLMAVFRAALFLLAFFYFDLLTAVIAIAAPAFVSFALILATQPNSSLSRSGIFSIAVALAVLIIETIFAFKGRIYREDEVRPVYAAMLAERLSMQAEVTAAREAQQRLMPAELPEPEHFSIAACCSPAFEVGGDFYDIFNLEDGKIGVLIAEGGGRGLGSALSIAYAKGYLMPKILSNAKTDDSPTEIIRGLQDRLASLLEEGSGLGLAYAVFDAGDGTLRYARTGTHPVIDVCKNKGASALCQPEERTIKFDPSRREAPNNPAPITVIEGAATLDVGDSVVLFTDGLAKDWRRNRTTPEKEFAKTIAVAGRKKGKDLQSALAASISACAKRAKKQGLEDDLTAVIVRFEKKQIAEQRESGSGQEGETA